jgi:hypothetical protein
LELLTTEEILMATPYIGYGLVIAFLEYDNYWNSNRTLLYYMKNIEWNHLYETIVWWEKQRIIFNLVVGISGLLPLIILLPSWFGIEEVIGILIWGIISNILYSSGILVEIFNLYYLNSKVNFFKFKFGFYFFGSLLYCVVTFFYSFLYFSPGL